METCPSCGTEIANPYNECPACKKKIRKPFSILGFLWENFRLFTMVGVTGTMISLIPNMGNRILGESWITNPDSYLPLFLSMIIFFGALFLTLCFLIIFSLIIQGRDSEVVRKKLTLFSKPISTWYEGDSQRSILLICLVPMWIGLFLFFLMLMPLIPNKYSLHFAIIVVLTCIPFVIYAFLGWNFGKRVTGIIPGLGKLPRLSLGIFTFLVIAFLVLVPVAIPQFFDNADTFQEVISIKPDQHYFSPHISSAKGLRLEITNLSGRELLESRHTWSADYGYFIRVTPSTSEVTILGNPVSDDNSRDIYWTYSENIPELNKKPVNIEMRLYPLQGNKEITRSSLCLTWFSNEIVSVNTSVKSVP